MRNVCVVSASSMLSNAMKRSSGLSCKSLSPSLFQKDVRCMAVQMCDLNFKLNFSNKRWNIQVSDRSPEVCVRSKRVESSKTQLVVLWRWGIWRKIRLEEAFCSVTCGTLCAGRIEQWLDANAKMRDKRDKRERFLAQSAFTVCLFVYRCRILVIDKSRTER